jgi:hypothetical protein
VGGTALKVLIAGFFVWLSAQMGTFADEILVRVRESVQASELLEIDTYVYQHSVLENERTHAPRDQAEFESILKEWLTASGGRDVTKDRWDRPYAYDHTPTRDPREVLYRIASGGPDRKLGTGDDIVVERENDHARINRDPARIAEEALERKKHLDEDTVSRIREILEAAKSGDPSAKPAGPAPKDVSPERQARELDESVRALAALVP